MAQLLEKTQSSYFPAFKELFKETVSALEEAQDIDCHLKPMAGHFESLETTEFDECQSLFDPMFHVICLVWANSKYYSRPARIIVLLQEINNLVIKRASEFLEPLDLFKGEPEESVEKIKQTYTAIESYTKSYEKHKLKLKDYFKNQSVKEWEFSPKLVFARWDKFTEKLNKIRDLFRIAMDFLRLEKVEIGGVKGKALSTRVVKIFEEFKDEFEKFSNKKYDPLDPKCDEFDQDYAEFEKFILDLDRRLSAIIGHAFDDCTTLASIFKLMTILGNILDRKTIRKDFEPRFAQIVNMLEQEMDNTKQIYDQGLNEKKLNENQTNDGGMQVHRNMPDVSGSLKWCHEMRERITRPMEQFNKLIDHPCKNSEQMERVNKKYKELLSLLDAFGQDVYKTWCGHVGKLSNNNLEKNLIIRDAKTKSIRTNFDPQLIAVLKEVKYLGILKTENIPQEALNIHKQNDEYRKYITSLDYTVDSYNKIIKTVSVEERPLIENELQKIDADLEKGEKTLKWNSPSISDYITDIRNKVSDLEQRLQKSKQNLEKIQTLMHTWNNISLFKRFEAKSTLLQLDDRQTRLDNRYKEIKETGQKIHDLVKENQQLLKVDNKETDTWKAYTVYVDRMLVDGFHKIIQCSLNYLLKETDHIKSSPDPLFEAQLQLKPSEMVFVPSMNYGGDSDGFYELIEGLVGNIYTQASLIPRIASHIGQEHYQVKTKEEEEEKHFYYSFSNSKS